MKSHLVKSLPKIPRDNINKLLQEELKLYSKKTKSFLKSSTKLDIDGRKCKFLNLITWVQFENTECAGTTGDNGTCFTSNECKDIGGTADGSCASGFGVCCVLKVKIGKIT